MSNAGVQGRASAPLDDARDHDLVIYFSRRLAWDADWESGLLDNAKRVQARCRTYLGHQAFQPFADDDGDDGRWEDLCDRAADETRRRTDLIAQSVHAVFYPLFILSAAIGDAYFSEFFWGGGFVVLLGALALFIPLTQGLSWALTGFGRRLSRSMQVKVGGPSLPRHVFDGSWPLRTPAIKLITPSFFVAMVGLLGAAVAIEHAVALGLTQTKAALTLAIQGKFAWSEVNPMARAAVYHSRVSYVKYWLFEGRGELALSALLALVAYLVERVLENLSLTREGLKGVMRDAKGAAQEMSRTKGDLSKLRDDVKSQTADYLASKNFARLSDTLKVANDLRIRAQTRIENISHSEPDPDGPLSVAMAEYTVGKRLDNFAVATGNLFNTIHTIITQNLKDPAVEVEALYQTNLIFTAFEAAFEGQDNLLKAASGNGRHFSIVAPLESLALVAANFIQMVLERPPHIQTAAKSRNVRYYTVLPLRPSDFFSRARWDGNPHRQLGAGEEPARPIDAKSSSWIKFLEQSRAALVPKKPVVIRHFVTVTEDLIDAVKKDFDVHAIKAAGELPGTPFQVDWDLPEAPQNVVESAEPCWNPIVLDSPRYLLREREFEDELDNCRLRRDGDPDHPVPWATVDKHAHASPHAGLLTPIPYAGVQIERKVKPAQPGDVSLREALWNYHSLDAGDGRGGGLRVIKIDGANWSNSQPTPQKPLSLLMERMGSEWVWVDYFASAVVVHGKGQRWAFAIKSFFHAEMGVVNMHLCFPGQSDWPLVMERLDRLFGTGNFSGQRDHIEAVGQ